MGWVLSSSGNGNVLSDGTRHYLSSSVTDGWVRSAKIPGAKNAQLKSFGLVHDSVYNTRAGFHSDVESVAVRAVPCTLVDADDPTQSLSPSAQYRFWPVPVAGDIDPTRFLDASGNVANPNPLQLPDDGYCWQAQAHLSRVLP